MSCHTAYQGWIWFREPRALGYKAIHGVVDLYVKDLGCDLSHDAVAARLKGQLPGGFVLALDTVPNSVLRAQMPRKLDPVTAFGADANNITDVEKFDAAVAACREAVRWIDAVGATLLTGKSL